MGRAGHFDLSLGSYIFRSLAAYKASVENRPRRSWPAGEPKEKIRTPVTRSPEVNCIVDNAPRFKYLIIDR